MRIVTKPDYLLFIVLGVPSSSKLEAFLVGSVLGSRSVLVKDSINTSVGQLRFRALAKLLLSLM